MEESKLTLIIAVCVVAVIVSAPLTGRGQPARGAGDAPVIMIVPTDQLEATEPVITAVTGHLSDVEVSFETSEVPALLPSLREQLEYAAKVAASSGALAVFWCDLSATGASLLYIAEPEADRILVRRLEGQTEEARAEELGVIIRSSLVEMLSGGTIGVRVVEALKARGLVLSSPPPPPVKSRESTDKKDEVHRLFDTVAYALCVHSEDHPAVHGLDLRLGLRINISWAVVLGYTVLSTVEETSDLVTVRLDRHPMTLGVSARFRAGPAWIGVSAGALLDYSTFENYTLASGMLSVADRADVLLSATAGVELHLPVAQRLSVFMYLGAEISVIASHYAVEGPNGRRVLLDSWPVQPWGLIGFLVEIL